MDIPLENDTAVQQDWPMTDAASGFCAFPSERSDPSLGSKSLGSSPEDISKVCQMAKAYSGHSSEPGTECATPAACSSCNGVWCDGKITSLLHVQSQVGNETQAEEAYPLQKDNETEKTWPMTDAADGFCAYPSERSDPELGGEKLGAAPTDPAEILKVCHMAQKYEGHRAVPGTECATPTTCGGCNGVWCKGTIKSLVQVQSQVANDTQAEEAYPLQKDNETEKTWPMTDAADGFCAYPSERSDPELGGEKLGAAPTDPAEILKVCHMAQKYEGHRAVPGTECATPTTCGGCNGVWCKGTIKSLVQVQSQVANDTQAEEAYPLQKDNETEKTWPMTDAADGFCGYPSERSDPELGGEKLGAAPTDPAEILKVCHMAQKYEGHRAVPGTECATPTTCGGCNGVWCKGTIKSLVQVQSQVANDTQAEEAYPLQKDNETEKTWPMTDAADGFCAYPSERSDPELGGEKLGAAPTDPAEILKVCHMAQKYEGHRAVPGTECATPTTCGGCNGVWCKGTIKSLVQVQSQVANDTQAEEAYPLQKDNETEKTWPMTDAADGFCAYPSERSDPELGGEKLGAAPTDPAEILKVCHMAQKYEGHRAVPGTECATPTTCGGCNGVWCKGRVKS